MFAELKKRMDGQIDPCGASWAGFAPAARR